MRSYSRFFAGGTSSERWSHAHVFLGWFGVMLANCKERSAPTRTPVASMAQLTRAEKSTASSNTKEAMPGSP